MIIEQDVTKELEIPSEGKFAIMFHLPGHCAGCKFALSVLQKKKLEDVTVMLIDAGLDENHDLIEKYNASTAPTIVVFNNGEEVGRMAGVREFTDKQVELLGD